MHYPGSVPLYPPADRYVEAFGEAQLRHWLSRRNIGGILMPLYVNYQTFTSEYTLNALAANPPCVRNSPGSDDYLTKEWRMVTALLPAGDRGLAESAGGREAGGAAKGDTIAIGPGAFGCIGPFCYQNHARPEDYRAALDRDRLPVWRGLELSADDLVRRAVMEALARHGRVSIEAIEIAHVIDFRSYFRVELQALAWLARAGLVALEGDWILVTDEGKRQLPRVCEVFDRYLRVQREHAALPRVM